jgi:predicted ATPase/DNA-binding SARP family transcriptional activator
MQDSHDREVGRQQPRQLHAQLLGDCSLAYNGRHIPPAAFKRQALPLLLNLLLAPGQMLLRDVALERLWPASKPDNANDSLNTVLSALRKALDDRDVVCSIRVRQNTAIALAPDLVRTIDAEEFKVAAEAALKGGEVAALRAAVALYAGPLLPQLRFEGWVKLRREELARLHRRVLVKLAQAEAQDDPAAAAERLGELLAANPTDEAVARTRMRLLAQAGRRAEALQVYERLVAALRKDLGVSASPETEAVRDEVRKQQATVQKIAVPPPPATTALPGVVAALPAGTTTFLLTDIEDSTCYWDQHPVAMRAALARHDALVAQALGRHDGRQVKERGEGDSIFAVFADPAGAVAAALAIGQALQAEPWPAGIAIRVRMGLHTGVAEQGDGDYYGPVVNRCARIRGLAHGGQILLSTATAALVREAVPVGAALRSLGLHRLKGLSVSEEVYQLCHPDLSDDFPPLRSPQVPKSNLPVALTNLIGREREQAAVQALVASSRLLTLVGAGGVGKTRLALAVADELVDQEPDGMWLVELAPLADPALVPGAVAQALALREEPGRPILATLIDHLKDKRLLLVLDNCEHLVAACAALCAATLRSCPGLRILVTSREALGVAGEILWPVPPLTQPAAGAEARPEELGQVAAVALFVVRAQAVRPGFALTAANAGTVAQICRRLDGLPLAIELAAARLQALAIEEMAARLDNRFRLLRRGDRTALPRHQSLQAVLDWSWDLLGAQEQALLRRLAVFAGGCTLSAAETVCADEALEADELLELLAGLVGKSLVGLHEAEHGARYGLLETVRQYAAMRLLDVGEDAAVRRRHLIWCVALAGEAASRLGGPDEGHWLDRLEPEHDNLRTALDWSLAVREHEEGMRLAAALGEFWRRRGHLSEGRRHLEALLEVGRDVSLPTRARALHGAGILAYEQGDYAQARERYEEALEHYRARGDGRNIAAVLSSLGSVARAACDGRSARSCFEESLALFRELGDTGGAGRALGNLGSLALQDGDYGEARARFEECLALFRQCSDQRGLAIAVNNLGLVAFAQGDLAQACVWLEESLLLARAQGSPLAIALATSNLGEVVAAQGDAARARAYHVESLTLWHRLGTKGRIAGSLEGLARLSALEHAVHDDEEVLLAARLCGAAEALRDAVGAPLAPVDRAVYDQMVTALRAAIGKEQCAAAMAKGRAMPLDEILSQAIHAADPGGNR